MRRALLPLAAVLLALVSLSLALPANAQGKPGESESQLGPLADCIRNRGRLAALLVIDQSGSLQDTDPDDTRVTGVEAALSGLAELTAGEAGSEVSVGIAGFDERYETVAPFTGLSAENLTELRQKAQTFADQDRGFDTDYVAALEGAQQAIAEQAIRMDPEGDKPVCRALMVFTDGKFDIEDRLTETQQRNHGTSKPWAPDYGLTTKDSGSGLVEKGKHRLCDPGGTVDQGRTAEIFTAVVALETEIEAVDRDFLRSIASGESGSEICGTPGADARRSGAYLPASDVDSLIAALLEVSTAQSPVPPGLEEVGSCPESEVTCDVGTKTFQLDASLSRFNLLALTSDSKVKVVLTGPDGDQVTVGRNGNREQTVSDASLRWTWLSTTAGLVTGNLPPSPAGWAGTWKVSFVDPTGGGSSSGNRVAIYIFGDVQAELVKPAQLRKGERGSFRVRLVNAAGQPRTPAAFTDGSKLTATIAVPGGKPVAVPLERLSDGTFEGSFEPSKELQGTSAKLHLELLPHTSFGVDLPSVGTDFDIPLANPSGFPQIVVDGSELRLSGIDGDGQASGKVKLVADKDGAGCAWVSDDKVQSTPRSVESVAVTSSFGSDEAGCTEVGASQTVDVTVSADPKGTGNGEVVGELQIELKNAATDEVRTEIVPFRFSMNRPIDRKKEAGILGGLILLGIAVPIGILYLINFLSRRFEPADTVRYARVPVMVTGREVARSDGGPTLLLGEEVRLLAVSRAREFEAPGLRFAARMPRSPFSAVYGEVTSQDGRLLVADRGMKKAGRSGVVSLGLGGTWVFTVEGASKPDRPVELVQRPASGGAWMSPDLPADPAPMPQEAQNPAPGTTDADVVLRGTLVCFFTDESFDAQRERMTEKVIKCLPDLHPTLAELAHPVGEAVAPPTDPAGGSTDGNFTVDLLPSDLPPLPVDSGVVPPPLPGDPPSARADDPNLATREPRRPFGRRSKAGPNPPAPPGPGPDSSNDLPHPGFDLPD